MIFLKSKKGFTLIELLVVIGILAVLAAIAIPSVAGLIDRANVSADNTNANEMTSALERFASEYELYCQDISSNTINPADLDSAQGRVYNVTKATTRADITKLESETGLNGIKINRDTKYPMNSDTMVAIVENYMKTSSSTFEPKQSDMSYWYNPDCGIVVVAKTEATASQLNDLVISGKDAKGNDLKNIETNWYNITTDNVTSSNTEINEYGFCYDVPYSNNVDGLNFAIVLGSNGKLDYYIGGFKISSHSYNCDNTTFWTVGNESEYGEIKNSTHLYWFNLGDLYAQANYFDIFSQTNNYGFYFDVPYINADGLIYVFHSDNSMTMYTELGGEKNVLPAGSLIYSSNNIAFAGETIVLEVRNNGNDLYLNGEFFASAR